MTTVEVITSVERRRRWSREEKLRIVAESAQPGRTTSPRPSQGDCRKAGVHRYIHDVHSNWHRSFCSRIWTWGAGRRSSRNTLARAAIANGGRNLSLLHEHLAHDDLVAWGWQPGEGRFIMHRKGAADPPEVAVILFERC